MPDTSTASSSDSSVRVSVRAIILGWLSAADRDPYRRMLGETIRSLVAAGARAELASPGARETVEAVDIGPAEGLDLVETPSPPRFGYLIEERNADWQEDYVLFLAPGDWVAPGLRAALGSSGSSWAALVFDHETPAPGDPSERYLKPCFSPDLLVEHDYVGRAVAFSPAALRCLAGDLHPDAPLRDGLLRLWEAGEPIGKVDELLLRATPLADPDVEDRLDADHGLAASWLARRGARAECASERGRVIVRYEPTDRTLVSVIVPFKDRPDLLRRVTDSVLSRTAGVDLELLLIDTGSTDRRCREILEQLGPDERVRVLDRPGVFNFSRVSNEAARAARGDVLAFLSNDIEVVTRDWLVQLAGYAEQEGVGEVGAKLVYPDGSIQDGGVVVGLTHLADSALRGARDADAPGFMVSHARNCSAVSAACCVIAAERFWEVGGFDERFRLTGGDVDLGLKLLDRGYRNVWVPHAVLRHAERATRSGIPVPASDKLLSLESYGRYLRGGDPYWNTRLSRDSTVPKLRSDDRPDRERLIAAVRHEVAEVRGYGTSDQRSALLSRYDCSAREVEAHRRLMHRFRDNRALAPVRTAAWFAPSFDHVYRGGIHTALRIAEQLSGADGCEHVIALTGTRPVDLDASREAIRAAFPALRFELVTQAPGEGDARLPDVEAAFCTHWTTAYHLLRFNRCRAKFYLVQDFEPAFSAADSSYALAEETYRLGIPGICNTPGVEARYAAYGNETVAFLPAVDPSVFHPPSGGRSEAPVQIAFYGRPERPRNGFQLGLMALRELKDRYRDEIRIVSAGADFDPGREGADGVIEVAGLLPDLMAVADLYRRSHIGLVFMFTAHPSYQPIELMACGSATVTNVNEATSWLIRHRENALICRPTVSGVVEAMSELVETPALRESISSAAVETASELEWPAQLERICRFIHGE